VRSEWPPCAGAGRLGRRRHLLLKTAANGRLSKCRSTRARSLCASRSPALARSTMPEYVPGTHWGKLSHANAAAGRHRTSRRLDGRLCWDPRHQGVRGKATRSREGAGHRRRRTFADEAGSPVAQRRNHPFRSATDQPFDLGSDAPIDAAVDLGASCHRTEDGAWTRAELFEDG
jgi:hypothetical protein